MSAEHALRTLIVDDEPLAIERLAILCAQTDAITLVGTASDGEAALRLIAALSPDLILLDITMPGIDGISLARTLETVTPRPAIIFCTAFAEYAVAAFDVAAVDYLLKPVAADRLTRAVGRVAETRVLEMGRSRVGGGAARAAWTEEFWVPHRSEMVRIAADRIDRIDAMRDYMSLRVGARDFLLHQTIGELERRLDPEKFIRLHRSTIVRRDFIAGLRHDGLGIWSACLADGAEVRIGRTYLAKVKALAGR